MVRVCRTQFELEILGLHRPSCGSDTLVYSVVGDNGAFAEGSVNGCYNEMSCFNGLQQAMETPQDLTERFGKLGGPESYNHSAVGWAHAMNTPDQWTRQVAFTPSGRQS